MARTTYTRKPTNQLQVGDVLNCHGAMCLITEPLTKTERGSYFTNTQIMSGAEHLHGFGRDGRWVVQGNELALWSVADLEA